MNNSPIANRTRARANIVQTDASNQDKMSERDLMRTPDSNGPVADLANGVIGGPNRSPDDFVGFDPNDIENVNASGYYNAFRASTENLGNLLHTQGHQNAQNTFMVSTESLSNLLHTQGHQNAQNTFMDSTGDLGNLLHTQGNQNPQNTGQNFGRLPHTQTNQSLPSGSRNFGQLPYAQTAQSLPSGQQGFGYVPHAHPDDFLPNPIQAHNYNAAIDNLAQARNKSTTEHNQFLTQQKVLDHITTIVGSKLLEINLILDDESFLTEPDKIELLREHRAWLEGQKTFASKKSGIVAQIVSTLQPTSLVFDDFLDLEQKFNSIEMQIITAVDKIKEKLAQFQKDKEISRKERIGLPRFKGDFIEFNRYRTAFTNFCKGLGEEDKKSHLINSLAPEPLSVVEPLVHADHTFQAIWNALVEHYANPKEILDSAVSKYLNMPTPKNKMDDLNGHFINMRNYAANIMRLNITLEQFLVQIYFLKIPGEFRGDLENDLPKEESRYNWKDIAPCVNKNIRAKKYSYNPDTPVKSYEPTTTVTATPGVVAQSSSTNQGDNTNQGGISNNQSGRTKLTCNICGKRNHRMSQCKTYKSGSEMRKMLQQIGRCDQCLLHSKDHPANCRSLASPCRTCGSTAHYSITCDGGQHPGSWVTKMTKPNNNQPVTKTVTQTLNSN